MTNPPPLPDLRAATLAAERGLAQFAADPVSVFRFKSEVTRKATRALLTHREVYLRTPNRGGKTHWAAHVIVAIARGRTEIDGERLPLLGVPNNGVVLAKGREMAKESVIRAYRLAVGSWPHHVERNGNAVAAIWVKPERSTSDDWNDWSCIRFFVEDGQSMAGMRLDWAHADEPPKEDGWRELRMRGRANRDFVRIITATPLDKREWKWLRDDFRASPAPDGRDGKIEFHMRHVKENKALSAEDVEQQERDAKGPLLKAKLYGEYVDLTGTNPFDAAGLKRWSERCKPPIRTERWTSEAGVQAEVEIWGEPAEGEHYLTVCDPSAGIWDEAGEHDPCEVCVVSRGVKGRPAVVARYNGYIPAFELGRLSRHLAERYNRALLVWERNSGYGESFYLAAKGYPNLYSEYHEDSLHMPLSERMGWLTTATTRGTIIGALQKAILEDGLLLLSAVAVSSLEDVVLDKRGRIEAGAGAHDEDMIVLGLACHLLETYPLVRQDVERTPEERMWQKMGVEYEDERDTGRDPFATL